MRVKHTPGPWALSYFGQRNEAGQKPYSVVTLEADDELAGPICDCATEANARLIVEAPEMLKAMLRVEPYLDAIVCYASTCNEYEPNDIAREFRNAIACANRGSAS